MEREKRAWERRTSRGDRPPGPLASVCREREASWSVFLPLRPSDRDRTRAIDALKSGYVEGRLSTQTFEARVAVAQGARSAATLRSLLGDLRGRWFAAHALLDPPVRSAIDPPPWATLMLSRYSPPQLVVGRSRTCGLVFGGDGVSRRHAGFERVDGQWYVTDLDSTNGTYVDDVQVQRAPIKTGSRVRLGDSILDVA
jgi:hypothetical protein